MSNKSFVDELQQYSADDLRLILNTQQELYSNEELKQIEKQLENRISQDKKDEEEFIKQHLPNEITCPKCDGVNSFENDKCCYCGHVFDKSKYYNKDYYLQDDFETAEEETDSKSYAFQYIISFIIPLVGFILGAILLSKDDEEEKSVGKTVIILGIVSIVIGTIITVFFLK